MTQVVAALIRDGDKFMIFQRPESKTRAFQWEFVGGKVEDGETLEEGLIRECMEEIGVKITVGDIFMEVDHTYPDIDIHLTLFNAEIAEGDIKMIEHNDIRSITPDEIDNYVFCPADDEILKKIKKEF
ncbi:MAG: (deoxy)nucleoside triphosphate pyrophosphohydrolase [Clostridia bacterium]|nr:(deoxy)nucleoside triphosphate pyrophosphohydrolase [Clostridia bacterium]